MLFFIQWWELVPRQMDVFFSTKGIFMNWAAKRWKTSVDETSGEGCRTLTELLISRDGEKARSGLSGHKQLHDQWSFKKSFENEFQTLVITCEQ